MSAPLPPRPSLTQLRHQAKDLLRAHKRGQPEVCARLWWLRRFARSDDAAILAADVALHEAQYVLAMEYGFDSWDALKRHVESQAPKPAVQRDERGAVMPGLEKFPIGGDGEHENSIIACLAAAMEVMGEDFSYEYLMGAGGAAFRIQHMWCPSSPHAECGYNCTHPAAAAAGYTVTWIQTTRDGQPVAEGIARAEKAITASIDQGRPALMGSEECSLIVGYTTDGRRLIRRYGPKKDGYEPTDKWPWEVGILERKGPPPPRQQAVIASLRTAVMLAKTPKFDTYASGFAALEQWAKELKDDSRFTGLDEKTWFRPALANGYTYGCLYASRLAAERYLNEVAEEFEAPMRERLLGLAERYGRVRDVLGRKRSRWDCPWSLMPWRLKSPDNWKRGMRYAQATVLRGVLYLEKQAVAEVEKTLALWDAQGQQLSSL